MSATFSENHVAEYRSDGLVILDGYFPADDIKRMRAAANDLLNLVLNSSIDLGEPNPRLDIMLSRGRQVVRKIQPVNDASSYFQEISDDPRLVEPIRTLFGCDPVLMEEKLNYKQALTPRLEIDAPEVEDSFPFHHDWGYYRTQNYPEETLSVAIFLDACTPKNGPLRVINGSHRTDWPLNNDGESPLVADGVFSHDDAVDVTGPPGTAMIFHSKPVHHSPPNATDEPRRVIIYSYCPSTFSTEDDVRNRPRRLAAQEFERLHRENLQSGAFVDSFAAKERDGIE